MRPRHLDPLALTMPSLAISCAAREALHQADIVETMLRGILPVLRKNDLKLSEELRKLDDTVDELYSAIKFYLTQISGEALSKEESRRWTDIVSFTINMEQIGDIIERVLQDIEDKLVKKSRSCLERNGTQPGVPCPGCAESGSPWLCVVRRESFGRPSGVICWSAGSETSNPRAARLVIALNTDAAHIASIITVARS
jgi:phosphate uptake regulator